MRAASVAPDETVEVAADEIADDDADVEDQDTQPVVGNERHRHAQIIISVGNTVREAAHDEEWHTEEQRKVLTLAGKGDCRGHDESAAYGKDASLERSDGKSSFEDLLCSVLKRHWRTACNEGYEQTAHDVAKEDEQQASALILLYESCCACIEAQAIVNHSEQAECEQHGSDDALFGKIAKACYADADACKYR